MSELGNIRPHLLVGWYLAASPRRVVSLAPSTLSNFICLLGHCRNVSHLVLESGPVGLSQGE